MTSPPAPPSTYAQGHTTSVVASHQQRTIHNSATFLLPRLAPHHTLLDIGCGPGSITVGFASILTRGNVTGIDLSQDVVDTARQLIGDKKNLSFETGNVLEGLKYEDDSFDVVYAHQTIIHIPNAVKALTEMNRVLKPGGILALRETAYIHWYPSTPGLEMWSKITNEMMKASGASGFVEGSLGSIVRRAGFEDGKVVEGVGSTTFITKDEREWFASTYGQRLKEGGVGKKAVEMGICDENAPEETAKALKEWGNKSGEEGAWYVAVQSEVLAWK